METAKEFKQIYVLKDHPAIAKTNKRKIGKNLNAHYIYLGQNITQSFKKMFYKEFSESKIKLYNTKVRGREGKTG